MPPPLLLPLPPPLLPPPLPPLLELLPGHVGEGTTQQVPWPGWQQLELPSGGVTQAWQSRSFSHWPHWPPPLLEPLLPPLLDAVPELLPLPPPLLPPPDPEDPERPPEPELPELDPELASEPASPCESRAFEPPHALANAAPAPPQSRTERRGVRAAFTAARYYARGGWILPPRKLTLFGLRATSTAPPKGPRPSACGGARWTPCPCPAGRCPACRRTRPRRAGAGPPPQSRSATAGASRRTDRAGCGRGPRARQPTP